MTRQREFIVRFIVEATGQDKAVTVRPGDALDSQDGEPGSLLQIAMSADVPIDHACGGVGACATCHVVVEQGGESIPPPDDDEEDKLDLAAGVRPTSRLACRAVPSGAADLVVRVPAWNRNAAAER